MIYVDAYEPSLTDRSSAFKREIDSGKERRPG